MEKAGEPLIQTISEALALFDEVLAYPWERTVVYQGNGPLVSEVPPPDDGPWNRPLYLTMAVPRRSGFRFFSWNTRPDGWGGNWQPGGRLPPEAGSVTLFAQWESVSALPPCPPCCLLHCGCCVHCGCPLADGCDQ